MSKKTASSSAECSWDKPPFSFVRGQYSTMWDIVWVSFLHPQQPHKTTIFDRVLTANNYRNILDI